MLGGVVPEKRCGGRRHGLGILRALLATTLMACGSEAKEISLAVSLLGKGAYQMEGTFSVDASSTLAWKVLADYSGISKFVPSMKVSKVSHRLGTTLWVEQEAEAGIWIITYTLHLSLEVVETPFREIAFRDEMLKDFSRYEGAWRVESGERVTVVTYRLIAAPSITVPEFMTEAVMKDNATRLLKEVRIEILKRRDHP